MAPGRPSTRQHTSTIHDQDTESNVNSDLFIDPMLGTPLAMYIEKDVEDKDTLVSLISKYGGSVSPGYSGVPYVLVDPHKVSGQNLWRQYTGKKGKIILDSRWIHECIKSNTLQTFHTNWAGCKVTGNEIVNNSGTEQNTITASSNTPETRSSTRRRTRTNNSVDTGSRQIQSAPDPPHAPPPPPPLHPQDMPPMTVGPLVDAHSPFPYHPVYGTDIHATRPMQPPPQTWQTSGGIAPHHTHLAPLPHMLHRPQFRDNTWNGYDHPAHPSEPINGPTTTGLDYRYREDQPTWVAGPNTYYDPSGYEQAYQQTTFIEEPHPDNTSTAGPSTVPAEPGPRRGRKRTRIQPMPATPASALVVNRHPPARSPTPPSRIIKSTYGGNLFTSDDVMYLKRYIDYCQEQGLVLSLREICERIAIKAPHHTFFSWRRYCNKHQIRLGGYVMNADRSESPIMEDGQEIEEEHITHPSPGHMPPITTAIPRIDPSLTRNRSPTPPRALFRSTTGKGVAFTDEDKSFLVRFMEYRKSQDRFDMVTFWKDVATKAPHHSRASWMKFWRRHKHEYTREGADEPLPQAPEKKMRYSRDDDVLLAKYFYGKPEGTSDKIFQTFGRLYPHHPWKGWQEHHRLHKAKIDHFVRMLHNGENIDIAEGTEG